MSLKIAFKEPEFKKRIAFTGTDFAHKCLYEAKFFSMPIKLERSNFVNLQLDFSKPCSSPDYLTPAEIRDVKVSCREIREGHSRKFENVNDFLDELKR